MEMGRESSTYVQVHGWNLATPGLLLLLVPLLMLVLGAVLLWVVAYFMISSGSNVGCSAKARGREGVGGRQRRSAAHAWSGEKLNSALGHADHVSSASLASWLYLGPGHWARGDRKQEGARHASSSAIQRCDDKCASAAHSF